MRPRHRGIFGITVILLVCAVGVRPAAAAEVGLDRLLTGDGIVVDHPRHPYGGPAADTQLIDMYGFEVWQLLADDIRLDEAAAIRRVSWLGFYDEDNPPASETFRIRFYDSRPGDGLPGDVLFQESFLNPSRTATGNIVPVSVDPDEYLFQVDLGGPFDMAADTTYWLEIVQIGDIGTHYRWEYGIGDLTGHAYVNPWTPDWTVAPTIDLSLQLSTIPEPTSAALFGLGIAALRGRRKEVV